LQWTGFTRNNQASSNKTGLLPELLMGILPCHSDIIILTSVIHNFSTLKKNLLYSLVFELTCVGTWKHQEQRFDMAILAEWCQSAIALP